VRRTTRRLDRRGFSLVELMVVVVILGMLAAIVVVNVAGQDDVARQKIAIAEIANINSAVTLYKGAHHKYPASLAELSAPDAKNANRSWLTGSSGKDPWGREYLFKKEKDGILVSSLGADGVKGGDGVNADIHGDKLHEFK